MQGLKDEDVLLAAANSVRATAEKGTRMHCPVKTRSDRRARRSAPTREHRQAPRHAARSPTEISELSKNRLHTCTVKQKCTKSQVTPKPGVYRAGGGVTRERHSASVRAAKGFARYEKVLAKRDSSLKHERVQPADAAPRRGVVCLLVATGDRNFICGINRPGVHAVRLGWRAAWSGRKQQQQRQGTGLRAHDSVIDPMPAMVPYAAARAAYNISGSH